MSESEKKIRGYLAGSCGNCCVLTDHVVCLFLGMIEDGDATIDDFRRIGGQYVVDRITDWLDGVSGVTHGA